MRECFRLAVRGEGLVSPNPMVGALIVEHGRIAARGYHRRYGAAHAEIDCLSRFHGDPRRATMYVNLEPCSHHGKTPPCADAILAAGIRNVVVAMRDPNPLVSGKGISKLRRGGVKVRTGILEQEARELNRVFVRHITARRPYVHVKVAQTLDGKIAPPSGRPIRISSPESLDLVHRWRASHDAVMVGAGTVIADRPRLTVRRVKGRNPDVVVLDGRFRVPLAARVFSKTWKRRAFVCIGEPAARANRRKVLTAEKRGVIVVPLPARGGRFRMRTLLRALYRYNIGSVLVEGGSDVFRTMAEEGPIDAISLFVAPRILGTGVPAFGGAVARRCRPLKETGCAVQRVGTDVLLQSWFDGGR